MASDIFKGISFTADCPSSNTNGKMPVLDLQLWLEKGEDGINIVRFGRCSRSGPSLRAIRREVLGDAVMVATASSARHCHDPVGKSRVLVALRVAQGF